MKTVNVCRCAQCRASKRKKRTSVRNMMKRYTSKLRRKAAPGQAKNFYWA